MNRSAEDRPRSWGRRGGPRPARDASSIDEAREVALRYLERRRRTCSEVAAKLTERGFTQVCVEQLIGRLTAVGLIDDRAYVEAYLRDRARFGPRSLRLLRAELQRRGVSAGDVDAGLEVLADEVGEVALACRLLTKRRARLAAAPEDKRRERAIALLKRGGFSWGTIEDALRAVPPGLLADDWPDTGGSASSLED